MIGRANDWFMSRHWFIRWLVYTELALVAPFFTLIVATSV
jgi:hypothetical protein